MIEELNRIIDTINSMNNWSKNEKLRYAYIELGKLVHKDVFFFYTIQNNLLNGKESLHYDVDKIEKMITSSDNFDYKVICRNSAEMLKYIYDHTGIQSEIRRTTRTNNYKEGDKEVQINHYFLVATGDDDKKYFLTLNPDLPNIKIGKSTSHFGNDIPYIQTDIIVDENGNRKEITYPAYEGEEVKASIMSEDELRKLDEKIGYDFTRFDGELVYTDRFFDELEKAYKYNYRTLNDGEYIETIKCETHFYYDMCNLLNGDKTLEDILDSDEMPTKEDYDNTCLEYDRLRLDEDTLNDLKLFALLETITRLYTKFSIDLDDNTLDDYIYHLSRKEYDILQKKFQVNFDGHEVTKLGPYNPIVQFKKTIEMFKKADDVVTKRQNNSPLEEQGLAIRAFLGSLKNVSLIFVPDEYMPTVGDRLNSSYMTNKIVKSFEKIFDVGHITSFNEMEVGEQVAIIKEVLGRIFTDTKLSGQDKSITGYRTDRSPLQNRVFSTVLFDKESNNPYYLMIVRRSQNEKEKNEGLVPIVFDLKRNVITTDKPITDIYDSFFIIKDNDFKMIIEQIEDKSI